MVDEHDCLNLLDGLDIDYEIVRHKAVYTIEEAAKELPGRMEIKNLFIQDDKGRRQYLVCMPGEKRLDLKLLAAELGEKKLRFCSAEKVGNMLGVKPGSVSLFCCLNPESSQVGIVFDEDLLNARENGFHPIVNTATVFISPQSTRKLLDNLTQDKRIVKI